MDKKAFLFKTGQNRWLLGEFMLLKGFRRPEQLSSLFCVTETVINGFSCCG